MVKPKGDIGNIPNVENMAAISAPTGGSKNIATIWAVVLDFISPVIF